MVHRIHTEHLIIWEQFLVLPPCHKIKENAEQSKRKLWIKGKFMQFFFSFGLHVQNTANYLVTMKCLDHDAFLSHIAQP